MFDDLKLYTPIYVFERKLLEQTNAKVFNVQLCMMLCWIC